MTRAVLDANILITAVIKRGGKPYQVTYLAPDRFDWLTSEFILSEVADVLTRKHIQTKYRRQSRPNDAGFSLPVSGPSPWS